MRIRTKIGILLLAVCCLSPITSLVAEESISDLLVGWIGYIDGDRIVISDMNNTFSSKVEYLDTEGLPVKSLHLAVRDRVLYRVNSGAEVVSIQKISGSLPAVDTSETVPTSTPSPSDEVQNSQKIKLIDGVWTN